MRDSGTEPAEQEPAQRISPWKAAVAVMMAGIVVFIVFILLRLVLPTNWAFTIEAETEVVEIKMRPGAEVRWLVDGATVCSRTDEDFRLPEEDLVKERADSEEPADPEEPTDPEKRPDPKERPNPCDGDKWQALRSPDPDPGKPPREHVLRLKGGASATMQLRPQRGFAVSLRSSDGKSLGGYSIVGVGDSDLGSKVNLIWTEVPQQSLTLPFSGEMTVGRAVSWFDTRVLHSGDVVVYTADESADKRKMIDEAELMLGDQVRLRAPRSEPYWLKPLLPWPKLEHPWRAPRHLWPKGFVYVTVEGGADTMQVVAFGHAGSIRIERFGESGYDFEPARIRALAADPAVAFWGSILAAYMTLILSLQPFVGDETAESGNATDWLKRFNRWLRSRPQT